MTLLGPFLADFGVPLGILLGAFGQLLDEPFLEAFSGGVQEGTGSPGGGTAWPRLGRGIPDRASLVRPGKKEDLQTPSAWRGGSSCPAGGPATVPGIG